MQVTQLLEAAIAVAEGDSKDGASRAKTFQASGTTSAGAGAATILVQGSTDGESWDTIGTITLTLGTASTSDSFRATAQGRHGGSLACCMQPSPTPGCQRLIAGRGR